MGLHGLLQGQLYLLFTKFGSHQKIRNTNRIELGTLKGEVHLEEQSVDGRFENR
jgi:hypothetical protein